MKPFEFRAPLRCRSRWNVEVMLLKYSILLVLHYGLCVLKSNVWDIVFREELAILKKQRLCMRPCDFLRGANPGCLRKASYSECSSCSHCFHCDQRRLTSRSIGCCCISVCQLDWLVRHRRVRERVSLIPQRTRLCTWIWENATRHR